MASPQPVSWRTSQYGMVRYPCKEHHSPAWQSWGSLFLMKDSQLDRSHHLQKVDWPIPLQQPSRERFPWQLSYPWPLLPSLYRGQWFQFWPVFQHRSCHNRPCWRFCSFHFAVAPLIAVWFLLSSSWLTRLDRWRLHLQIWLQQPSSPLPSFLPPCRCRSHIGFLHNKNG